MVHHPTAGGTRYENGKICVIHLICHHPLILARLELFRGIPPLHKNQVILKALIFGQFYLYKSR